MVKHIIEIVKKTEFINACQTPVLHSLNVLGPLFCTLLAKLGPWG